ncbi:MAG: MATE family efflux transporter [Rickettsiales bacterium]|jgi:putative MATE family efflux protein|nr:MATE family efflux transporter [Rickettsiales bacterium]
MTAAIRTEKDTKTLGTAPVGGLLWRFSVPAVFAVLVGMIYNMTDRYFFSQYVEMEGMAGLAVSTPLFMIAIAIEVMTGIGGNALFSIRLGQKRNQDAERVLCNTFLLQIFLGAAYATIALAFLPQILKALGASERVMPYAMDYMKLIVIGAPFNIIGYGMNNFIRSSGHPFRAMSNTVIGAVLNGVLDWLFMSKFGWGAAGAGLATMISMIATCALVMSHFLRPGVPIRLRREYLRPDFGIIANVAKYGISPFILHIAFVINGYVMNTMILGHGGDMEISAFAIVNSVVLCCALPALGITQGMQPISGYNFGAKQYDRVRRVVLLALVATTSWITLCWSVAQLAPHKIVGVFADAHAAPALHETAVHMLRIDAAILPLIGAIYTAGAFLLSTGKVARSITLSISRQLVFLLPLLLVLPGIYGLDGVLWALVLGDVLGFALAVAFLTVEMRRMKE